MLGSLRDALAAATREDRPPPLPVLVEEKGAGQNGTVAIDSGQSGPSAAEAAREARAIARERTEDAHVEIDTPRRSASENRLADQTGDTAPARTRLLRGRQTLKRTEFSQDPVVGWLVVVGGPGLGAFRPIFEGNNAVGRSRSQRIPIDFGDDAISGEEQAFIRYDSVDRKFLLVPNLAKTNIVAVNDRKPTGAVELAAMDLITMGRTQLVFVPFCGPEFDWSELTEIRG
jgi:hypothetical protein